MVTKNSLVLLSSYTITSGEESITLTGITTDYNVCLFTYRNLTPTLDNQSLLMQFTVGGVTDTTANYTGHMMSIRDTGDANRPFTNQTYGIITENTGNAANEVCNGNVWIYSAANSAEHTTASVDTIYTTSGAVYRNEVGHFRHEQNEAHDGVTIDLGGVNDILSGEFRLYGLVK